MGAAADHLSEASLHDVWRRQRTLYRWASRRLEISNPIERIDPASGHVHFLLEKPRVPEAFPRILSHEQVQDLLHEGCASRRDRLMVLIPLDMGLRLSEIAHLSTDSSSSEGVRIKGKGNKTRTVSISRELYCELENSGSLEHVWLGKKQSHLAPDGVKSAFRRIFHWARIKAGPIPFSTLSPRNRLDEGERYGHCSASLVIRGSARLISIRTWSMTMWSGITAKSRLFRNGLHRWTGFCSVDNRLVGNDGRSVSGPVPKPTPSA